MWPAIPIPDVILLILKMHLIILGYMEDELSCFTELSDDNMEKSNRILSGRDNTSVIPDNDDK